MHLSEFDYELPPELIAQRPLERRDASRMLILDRSQGIWSDAAFTTFPDLLRPNDVLVLNNTRVFPARLVGQREPSGGRIEVLLVRELEPLLWETLVRGSTPAATCILRFECDGSFYQVLDELGHTPLPPYIRRDDGQDEADRERYQTVFASARGAIAAPTAGLHFTREVLDRISQGGTEIVELTLHVGYGTFAPVRVEEVADHRVEPELFAVPDATAEIINRARSKGGRLIAVGTTTTRALESAASSSGEIQPVTGQAGVTITPGYRFRAVDALLTNFHLPRSSLLLLVCAFAGSHFVLSAYRHAVRARYRFYSYGDCMFAC
jgi:S-adenosylmethionine:tRNA ribosyltransferase-isomerase